MCRRAVVCAIQRPCIKWIIDCCGKLKSKSSDKSELKMSGDCYMERGPCDRPSLAFSQAPRYILMYYSWHRMFLPEQILLGKTNCRSEEALSGPMPFIGDGGTVGSRFGWTLRKVWNFEKCPIFYCYMDQYKVVFSVKWGGPVLALGAIFEQNLFSNISLY